MENNDLLNTDANVAQNANTRPANVPEKFWDNGAGALRTDALLKSYQDLERKMSGMVDPQNQTQLNRAIGVPDAPEGYAINCDHGYFTPSTDINTQLHGAGFTQNQAQLVYDLAAQHLVPMIIEIANEFNAEREQERLMNEFGGNAQWQETSRQIATWANQHLPTEAVKGLATTYQGIMALYHMMQNQDPTAIKNGANTAGGTDLNALVRDPRYWQQKDPAYVAQVTEAFQRQYGGQGA